MDRGTLERVIEDLQNEHTRWENRARRFALTAEQDATAAEELRTHLARADYIELLIRRYRDWLPAP